MDSGKISSLGLVQNIHRQTGLCTAPAYGGAGQVGMDAEHVFAILGDADLLVGGEKHALHIAD